MIKKRTAVRCLSFSLALTLLCVGLYAGERSRRIQYESLQNARYEEAFYELEASLSDIRNDLKKLLYISPGKKAAALSASLLYKAESAKMALAQLPQEEKLDDLQLFLSQVGHYAVALTAETQAEPEKSTENLKKLYEISQSFSSAVRDTANGLADPKEFSERVEQAGAQSGELFGDALVLEETADGYPKLIYDGPYADVNENPESFLLAEAAVISEEEALRNARNAGILKGNPVYSQTVEGKIPYYLYTEEEKSLALSCAGGYPLFYRNPREIAKPVIQPSRACEYAGEYLRLCGYAGMAETYYQETDGVCVVNFAYRSGGVIYYPDLIQVSVALDTGEVVGMDARGYLMNHRQRTIATARYTEEEAAERLSDNVTVLAVSSVVIAVHGKEKVCYEFLCRGIDEEKVLLYLERRTLEEEDVLILQENEGGTLVS